MSPTSPSTDSQASTDHDFKSKPHLSVIQLPYGERRPLAQLSTLPDFDVLCEDFYVAVERHREHTAKENQAFPKVEGEVHPSRPEPQAIGHRPSGSPPSLEIQLQDFLAQFCTERNETSLRLAAQSIVRAPTLADIQDIIGQFDNLTGSINTIAKNCLSIRNRNNIPLQVPSATPYRNEALPHAPLILFESSEDESPNVPIVIQSSQKKTTSTVTTSEPPLPISSISSSKRPSASKSKVDQTSSQSTKSKLSKYLVVRDRQAQINQQKIRFRWWYYESSEKTIDSPMLTPEDEKIMIGDLYFYRTTTRPTTTATPADSMANSQAWMFTANSNWMDITSLWELDDGSLRHPLDPSRVLTARSDGTPTYVAESTWKGKVREKERISVSIAASISSLSTNETSREEQPLHTSSTEKEKS